MGDMADYYREASRYWVDDAAWEQAFVDEDELEEPTRESLWRTRAGQAIRVCDLKDDHLCNILRMWKRGNLQLPNAWQTCLEREAALRKLKL